MNNENWMHKFHDLQAAVIALYYSAYWHPDRPVDAAFLWTAVRDAAGITPGKSAERLGPDRTRPEARPKELDAAMDNVLAWRMGEAANAAVKDAAGDLIDRGLALLRQLNERGFTVHGPQSSGS